jgi:hypothetical protein
MASILRSSWTVLSVSNLRDSLVATSPKMIENYSDAKQVN